MCVVVYVYDASGSDSMLSIDVRSIFLDMLATRACYNHNKNIIIILIITISHTGFGLHARDYIVYFVIVLGFFFSFEYFGNLFDIVDSYVSISVLVWLLLPVYTPRAQCQGKFERGPRAEILNRIAFIFSQLIARLCLCVSVHL